MPDTLAVEQANCFLSNASWQGDLGLLHLLRNVAFLRFVAGQLAASINALAANFMQDLFYESRKVQV
jgi:hypothetical protein